jgi:hypothetical protein
MLENNMSDKGTLYVIMNPLFPNYIKIGHTKCLYSRLKKLSTGVPKAYKVIFHKEYDNVKKIESHLHSVYRESYSLNAGLISKEWYPVGREKDFFMDLEEFMTDIMREINRAEKWFNQ